MKKATPSWQVIENVVAALQKVSAQVPGIRVTQRAQLPRLTAATMTRDVDVLVERDLDARTHRTCIEVKNKRRPLTIEQMGCIADLARDVAHDRFVVVSTSGFSEGARVKAAENEIEIATLEEFEQSDFWAYAPKVTVVTHGGHLLYTSFEFSPDDLAAAGDVIASALEGACPDDLVLENATGSVTVTHFMSAMFQQHRERGGQTPEDGALMSLTVDLANLPGVTMMRKGVRLPRPRTITSQFRYSRSVQEARERRFRSGNIELTTTEMGVLDRDVQVSLAKVPQADGSTQLVVSQGPVRPPKARG